MIDVDEGGKKGFQKIERRFLDEISEMGCDEEVRNWEIQI